MLIPCIDGCLIYNNFHNLSLDKGLKIAFLALFVLTFSYLGFIGYTTSDDVQIAEQSFSETFNNAFNAGRLTWIISMPSSLISEIQGNIWYYKILRLAWVGALFHSAYLLLREHLSVQAAIFVSLFPIIFFVNDLDHHAFSSYPGLVVYALACFFYSIYFINLYLRDDNKFYLIFSGLLFFLSFVTELFPTLIIFLLFYPRFNIRKRLIKLIPHLIILITFIISYYQFKADAQSYAMNFGWAALKTWYVYSFAQIYEVFKGVINSIKYINLTFFIKTIIMSLFVLYIYKTCISYIRNNKSTVFVCGKLIFWWLLLSAWINVPVSLTLNYQHWVSIGSKAYLYSALSNFCCSIAIGLFCWATLTKFQSIKWLWKILIIFLLAIFISNQIKSNANYHQQMYSHQRWIYIDDLAKREFFKSNVCYLSPWLFELNGIVGIRTPIYWESYLLRNWGINAHILKNESDRACGSYQLLIDPRVKK